MSAADLDAQIMAVRECIERHENTLRACPHAEPSRRRLEGLRAALATLERDQCQASYRIAAPDGGWRAVGSFSGPEKRRLRPIAETLAMLDGNAFLSFRNPAGGEWYEQYLPEAHALFEASGGIGGWAGEASFVRLAAALPNILSVSQKHMLSIHGHYVESATAASRPEHEDDGA